MTVGKEERDTYCHYSKCFCPRRDYRARVVRKACLGRLYVGGSWWDDGGVGLS